MSMIRMDGCVGGGGGGGGGRFNFIKGKGKVFSLKSFEINN